MLHVEQMSDTFERTSESSITSHIFDTFARHPHVARSLAQYFNVLNTAGGLTADPVVMDRLRTLSMNAVRNPDRDAVRKRLEWLMHDPKIVSDDLVEMRYRVYTQPGAEKMMDHIMCLQIMDVRRR